MASHLTDPLSDPLNNPLGSQVHVETIRRHALEVWDHSPDGLLLVDASGNIAVANPACHQILGYETDALQGCPVEILVPDAQRGHHRQLRQDYGRDPGIRRMGIGLRLSAVKADGTLLPVQISLAPLGYGAEPLTLAALRDVSDWVEAETQITELNLKRMVAEERDRIARDLHDNVIQELFAVGLALQGAVGLRGADLDDRLISAVESIDDTISSIRRAVFGVSGGRYRGSIKANLLNLIADRTAALPFEPEIIVSGPLDELPDELANDLAAAASEALTNVVRHSEASSLSLSVELYKDRLTLEVADNGKGIAGSRRSGLNNLADRATRHGGRLELDTGAGIGTRLSWIIPLGPSNR